MTHPHNIIERMKFGCINGTIFKQTNTEGGTLNNRNAGLYCP